MMGPHASGDNLVRRRVQWDSSPASMTGLDGYQYTVSGSHRDGSDPIRPPRRKARASDGLPLPLWLTNTFFAISFVLSSYFLLGRWRLKLEAHEKLHHLTWGELMAVILDMSSFIYLISFCGIGYVQNSVANLDSDSDDEEPLSDEIIMPGRSCMKLPPHRAGILALNSPLSSPFSSMESLAAHPSPLSHLYSDHSKPSPKSLPSHSDSHTYSKADVTPEPKKPRGSLASTKPPLSHISAHSPAAKHESESHLAVHSPASVSSSPRVDLPQEPLLELTEAERELAGAVSRGEVPLHSLENRLGDAKKAAQVRRLAVELRTGKSLKGLPLDHYDYEVIRGACCEMVVGHVTIPVGVAGPLLLDGKEYFVPMATTEGCLVASTNRGCKAIIEGGGRRVWCTVTA